MAETTFIAQAEASRPRRRFSSSGIGIELPIWTRVPRFLNDLQVGHMKCMNSRFRCKASGSSWCVDPRMIFCTSISKHCPHWPHISNLMAQFMPTATSTCPCLHALDPDVEQDLARRTPEDSGAALPSWSSRSGQNLSTSRCTSAGRRSPPPQATQTDPAARAEHCKHPTFCYGRDLALNLLPTRSAALTKKLYS